jgi:hypothetical protein
MKLVSLLSISLAARGSDDVSITSCNLAPWRYACTFNFLAITYRTYIHTSLYRSNIVEEQGRDGHVEAFWVQAKGIGACKTFE